MLEEIQNTIDEWTENVLDGSFDPLETYTYLKAIKKKVDNSLAMVHSSVIEEAKKYPDKTFEYLGMKFELRNGKKTYKFDHIHEWAELKEKRARIENIAKAAALNNSIAVNPDTGEEIEPAKISFAPDSLIVTL